MSLWTPVVTALAGAFVGFLAAEIRRYIDDRRAERRTLNRVLYVQLQILRALRRTDVRRSLQIVVSIVARQLDIPLAVAQADFAKYPQILDALKKAIAEMGETHLGERYEAAMDDLALVDPILAHSVGGVHVLAKYEAFLDTYLRIATADGSGGPKELPPGLRELLEGHVFNSAVSNIEADIHEVAARLSRRTVKAVHAALRQMAAPLDDKAEAELGDLMRTAIGRAAGQQGGGVREHRGENGG